jgi:hypothetical protein
VVIGHAFSPIGRQILEFRCAGLLTYALCTVLSTLSVGLGRFCTPSRIPGVSVWTSARSAHRVEEYHIAETDFQLCAQQSGDPG